MWKHYYTCSKLNKAGYWALTSVSSMFWFISFLRSGKVRTIRLSTFSQSGFLFLASLCSHSLWRFIECSSSPSGKGGSQLMPPRLSFSATGWASDPFVFFLLWRITSGSFTIDLRSLRNFSYSCANQESYKFKSIF